MMGEVAGEHCQHNLEACHLRVGLNNYYFVCVFLIPAVYNLLSYNLPQAKLEQDARGWGWGGISKLDKQYKCGQNSGVQHKIY